MHDGQSQATAFGGAIGAAVEAFEDVRQLIEADASAIVLYPHPQNLLSLLSAYFHLSAGRGELNSIVQEIAHRRFDTGLVASQRDFGDRPLYGEVNPLFTRQALECCNGCLDQLPDRVIGHVQMDQPRVEARQIKQIVGDVFQTVDLGLAFGEKLATCRRFIRGRALQ